MSRRSGGEAGQGQTRSENVFAEAGGWVLRIERIYEQGIIGLERNWLCDFWKRGRRSHLRGPPAALQRLNEGCFGHNHWHSLAGLSSKVKNKFAAFTVPTMIRSSICLWYAQRSLR